MSSLLTTLILTLVKDVACNLTEDFDDSVTDGYARDVNKATINTFWEGVNKESTRG